MHPAWLRCKSSEYPDIPALLRLARRAPQHLKLRTYFCANPKEIKDNEYRAGITPGGVRQLAQAGHQVLVETGAGEGSGFSELCIQYSGRCSENKHVCSQQRNPAICPKAGKYGTGSRN